MKTMNSSGWLAAVALACGLWLASAAWSDELPGKGVRVAPIKSPLAEETFQTLLVNRALEKLGYDVQPIRELEYATGFLALSTGDATFLAVNWEPQQKDFYKNSGGDEKLYRKGTYVANSTQGYLIDKKTAQAHNITSIAQLKDPALAKLFDIDGDGKADLTGCNPGWYCEFIIEHHLDVYGLRDTVSQNQGAYPALIADTIARFRQGKPVLYWTWTPYWVSAVMRPGKDVVFLQVPFSSLPGEQAGISTRQPNGSDYGFPVNTQHIVANRVFADQNPAAAKLFEIMELPVADINAQNQRMYNGENSPADVERHVDGWIRAHQATFDGWVGQAKAAAAK